MHTQNILTGTPQSQGPSTVISTTGTKLEKKTICISATCSDHLIKIWRKASGTNKIGHGWGVMTLIEWQLRLYGLILNVKGLNYSWKVQGKRVNLIISSELTSYSGKKSQLCSLPQSSSVHKERCWWSLSSPLRDEGHGGCHKLCNYSIRESLGCHRDKKKVGSPPAWRRTQGYFSSSRYCKH